MSPKVAPDNGFATIPTVARELDLKPTYVRTLIRQGKIKGAKRRMLNETQWRWEIPLEWVENKRQTGSRTKREDGRNKFLIWMNPVELETFEKLLAEHLPDVPFENAYKRSGPTLEEVDFE